MGLLILPIHVYAVVYVFLSTLAIVLFQSPKIVEFCCNSFQNLKNIK